MSDDEHPCYLRLKWLSFMSLPNSFMSLFVKAWAASSVLLISVTACFALLYVSSSKRCLFPVINRTMSPKIAPESQLRQVPSSSSSVTSLNDVLLSNRAASIQFLRLFAYSLSPSSCFTFELVTRISTVGSFNGYNLPSNDL